MNCSISCIVFILLVFGCLFAKTGAQSKEDDSIPDEYIVVMQGESTGRSKNRVETLDIEAMMNEVYHLSIKRDMTLGSRRYLSVKGKETDVLRLRELSDVVMVEPNKVVRGFLSTAMPDVITTAPAEPEMDPCQTHSTTIGDDIVWGVDRLNTRTWTNTPTGLYEYSSMDDGHGVIVYVVDSGIKIDHAEFQNRASWGFSSIEDEPSLDLNGHGTHVAGIIGAAQYGVARNASLVSVKVLDADGSGAIAGIIEAFQWILNDYDSRDKPKSIINLSLGVAGISDSLDDAVEIMIQQGIPTVIAAGNDAQDACDVSPARVPSGITVGASAIDDSMAYFSNYGTCVDLFAPGHEIPSTYHNYEITKFISGTSQAAPHVAGVIARYLSTLDYTPTPNGVSDWLIKMSTKDAIEMPYYEKGSANRLLYMHCYNGGSWEFEPSDGDTASSLKSNVEILFCLLIVLIFIF